MNGSHAQVTDFFPEMLDGLLETSDLPTQVRVAVCPPFPYLDKISGLMMAYPVRVGAQDVSAHPDGAYTGEVSVSMLQDLGITLCIVGHSERRQYHSETDAQVAEKVSVLLAAGITPIACVGETAAQRKQGEHMTTVENQLNGVLQGVDGEKATELILAYEPVWAIGTGLTATPEQAAEMHAHVRELLKGRFGDEAGAEIPILYGGSVNAENARELLTQAEINGALVGGASLKPGAFVSIIQQSKH